MTILLYLEPNARGPIMTTKSHTHIIPVKHNQLAHGTDGGRKKMEGQLENLQTLYAELEQLETCPLKLSCYSLNRGDLQGEVLDCLNSFFERRLR